MDYLVLMEINETIEYLFGIDFYCLLWKFSIVLIYAAYTSAWKVFKVYAKLIIDDFTTNILNDIFIIKFSIDFNLFLYSYNKKMRKLL